MFPALFQLYRCAQVYPILGSPSARLHLSQSYPRCSLTSLATDYTLWSTVLDVSSPLNIFRTEIISPAFPGCPMRGAFPTASPQMFVKCKTNEQRESSCTEEFLSTWPPDLWMFGLDRKGRAGRPANPAILARPPNLATFS